MYGLGVVCTANDLVIGFFGDSVCITCPGFQYSRKLTEISLHSPKAFLVWFMFFSGDVACADALQVSPNTQNTQVKIFVEIFINGTLQDFGGMGKNRFSSTPRIPASPMPWSWN